MPKVAVKRSEQSALSKAVKNVTEKLSKTTKKNLIEVEVPAETVTVPQKNKIFHRGIVYVGHIPHGFYETEMQDYFSQFGKVLRVRLVRSKKTGGSRGYAYIEFADNEVAKIAAASMNNYLMCGKLLKASYIPPERRHTGFFSGKQWTKKNYPRLRNRREQTLSRNKNLDKKTDGKKLVKRINRLATMKRKLAKAGIKYEIDPVEIPVINDK